MHFLAQLINLALQRLLAAIYFMAQGQVLLAGVFAKLVNFRAFSRMPAL